MSDFTDSLLNCDGTPDDEFKLFLLKQLDHAVDKHDENIDNEKGDREYWQGRKDAIRVVLACYLNDPEIARYIFSSIYAIYHNSDVV